MTKNNEFVYFCDNVNFEEVETKSGKDFYVSGYISTGDIDLVNEVVTDNCMKSMLEQLKSRNITLDYDHEAFRNNPTILPSGKIIEGKIDKKGLWVKAKLNPASPKFKALWESIKGGFVNAFSIAYKATKVLKKKVGEKTIKVLDDVNLLNVALTGAPVNSSAIMTDFGMKGIMLKSINDFEDVEVAKMPEEKEKTEAPKEDAPKEEVKEEPKEEAKVEEKAEEEKPKEEPKEEAKVEEKAKEEAIEKLTADLKSMREDLDTTKKELKSMKDKPVFKSKQEEMPIEVKSEKKLKGMLDVI